MSSMLIKAKHVPTDMQNDVTFQLQKKISIRFLNSKPFYAHLIVMILIMVKWWPPSLSELT